MKRAVEHLLLPSLALILGLGFLGVSALVVPAGTNPSGLRSVGFPVAYGTQVDCYLSGPGGCGYSYDITLITLDYLFWVVVASAIVFPANMIRVRSVLKTQNEDEKSRNRHL